MKFGRAINIEVAFNLQRRDGPVAHGRTNFCTTPNSCSGLKGFTTHALAPASWPWRFLASADSVVNMTMGVNLYDGFCLTVLTKVMPSMTGMFTSLTIM